MAYYDPMAPWGPSMNSSELFNPRARFERFASFFDDAQPSVAMGRSEYLGEMRKRGMKTAPTEQQPKTALKQDVPTPQAAMNSEVATPQDGREIYRPKIGLPEETRELAAVRKGLGWMFGRIIPDAETAGAVAMGRTAAPGSYKDFFQQVTGRAPSQGELNTATEETPGVNRPDVVYNPNHPDRVAARTQQFQNLVDGAQVPPLPGTPWPTNYGPTPTLPDTGARAMLTPEAFERLQSGPIRESFQDPTGERTQERLSQFADLAQQGYGTGLIKDKSGVMTQVTKNRPDTNAQDPTVMSADLAPQGGVKPKGDKFMAMLDEPGQAYYNNQLLESKAAAGAALEKAAAMKAQGQQAQALVKEARAQADLLKEQKRQFQMRNTGLGAFTGKPREIAAKKRYVEEQMAKFDALIGQAEQVAGERRAAASGLSEQIGLATTQAQALEEQAPQIAQNNTTLWNTQRQEAQAKEQRILDRQKAQDQYRAQTALARAQQAIAKGQDPDNKLKDLMAGLKAATEALGETGEEMPEAAAQAKAAVDYYTRQIAATLANPTGDPEVAKALEEYRAMFGEDPSEPEMAAIQQKYAK